MVSLRRKPQNIFSSFLKAVIFFLLLFIFLPSQEVEAKSYSITNVSIIAQLREDGSMFVEESRTFLFDGSFTYAYQSINTLGDPKAKPGRTEPYVLNDFQVCDEKQCYRQLTSQEMANADGLKPRETFYVKKQSDQYYIKWFYKADNESKRFKLRYLVNNAITLHKDVAELYWKLVGDAWEIKQR